MGPNAIVATNVCVHSPLNYFIWNTKEFFKEDSIAWKDFTHCYFWMPLYRSIDSTGSKGDTFNEDIVCIPEGMAS